MHLQEGEKMVLCKECEEVKNILDIDIERLIQELGSQKGEGKNLNGREQLYLCLSLLGNGPRDIAELEDKNTESIRNYLANTINGYVKNFMRADDNENRPSWLRVVCFLKKNGYTIVDPCGESKKMKIILGAKQSDLATVDLLRILKLDNYNISVVFENKGDEQND